MDAVVICGGKGTRVRSITDDKIPKILIPVNGKPFLEHVIHTMYRYGVRRMTLAAGFQGGVLREYLDRRHYLSSINPWMEINVNLEAEPLDTGGAVLNCLNRSGSGPHSEPFLVMNGDCLILPGEVDSFEELYYEIAGKPDCAMFTCKKEHDGRYGSLKFAPYSPFNNLGGGAYQEEIVGFENGKEGESWINCGWYIMRREMFRKYYNPICNRDKIQIYDVNRMSLEKELFPGYLEDGQAISAIIVNEDQFLEIGTPEALEAASRRLRE